MMPAREKQAFCQNLFSAKDVSYSSILREVNFMISSESLVTIIGSSGSGKSTLLRLLNRLHSLTGGTLTYRGIPLADWDVLELRRQVRMVFQTPTMLPGTVRENLTTTNHLHGMKVIDNDHIEQLMQALGLDSGMLERNASELSGGQKARVALGRAMFDLPPVLLCDEVTAALDQESKSLIEDLVLGYQREHGGACFWVTHDLRQARKMGTETWVLDQGQLVEAGQTEEIFTSPKHPATQRLLSRMNEVLEAGMG